MAFIHDGTEDFESGTAYWLRDPETNQRIPVYDPVTAQQAAGPLPVAKTPEQERLMAPLPDRRVAGEGMAGYMDALDAQSAAPTEGKSVAERFMDEQDAQPQAGAHVPRPVGKSLPARDATRFDDEEGLVYMHDEAQPGAPGGPPGAAPQESPYASNTPFRLPGLDVDPRHFMRRATPGGWQAASKKEKGDPEEVANLRQMGSDLLTHQVATALAERDIKQSVAEQRRADLALTQTRNQEEQRALQVRMAQQEREKRDRLQMLDRESADLANKKVDPNRWYANAGPAGVILAALARGAGTFAGNEDPGKIIDSFIAADIAQQEEDYRSAADNLDVKRNAFAREMQEGADPEIARKKIELLQTQYAENLVKDREYQEGLQALGVDTDKLINEFAQKSLDRRAQFEALLGQELDSKYRQASGGGFDLKGYLETRKLAADVNRAEGEAYGAFPTEGERLKAMEQAGLGGKQTKEFQGQVERLGDKMSSGGVTMGDLMMARDQFEGTVRSLAEANGQDIPGTGSISGLLPNLLAGQDGRKVRREAGRLTNFFLKRLSGAASPDAEVIKQMQQDLAVYDDMSASDEEVAAALDSTSSLIDAMAATRAAGFKPEVYDAWRDNLRQIQERSGRKPNLLGGSTFEED